MIRELTSWRSVFASSNAENTYTKFRTLCGIEKEQIYFVVIEFNQSWNTVAMINHLSTTTLVDVTWETDIPIVLWFGFKQMLSVFVMVSYNHFQDSFPFVGFSIQTVI